MRCKEQKDVDDGGLGHNGIEVDGATFIWEGKRIIPDDGKDKATVEGDEEDGEEVRMDDE